MLLSVELTGTHPLIMANARAVNKFDELVQELDKLTGKGSKGRTLEELNDIADLEFEIYMYYDDAAGPYLPGDNLMASIKEGAIKFKKGMGPKVETGVIVLTDIIPVNYKGSRDIDEFIHDKNFRFTTAVGQGTGKKKVRLMKTRPIFQSWSIRAEVELDTEQIDLTTFEESVKTAGRLCGIGGYRPRYGRYTATVKKIKQ